MDNHHFNTEREVAKLRIDTISGSMKGYHKAHELQSHRTSAAGLATSFPAATYSPPSKGTEEHSGCLPRFSKHQPRDKNTIPNRQTSVHNIGGGSASTIYSRAVFNYLGVDYLG